MKTKDTSYDIKWCLLMLVVIAMAFTLREMWLTMLQATVGALSLIIHLVRLFRNSRTQN